MNDNTKYQTLLYSTKTTPRQIEEYVNRIDHQNTNYLLNIFAFIQTALSRKVDPHTKLNSIILVLNLVKKGHYYIINLTETLLIPQIVIPAKVAASGDHSRIYDFFQKQGCSTHIPNLQPLSYHFTRYSLILCLITSYLRPKRLYKNREINLPSLAKKIEEQLFEIGLTQKQYEQIIFTGNFLQSRKQSVKSLIKFHKNPDSYIHPLIKIFQKYLINNKKSRLFQISTMLLKSHDAYLCTELVPRLSEILCYHSNFRIKSQSLRIINEIFYSGDLETLVIINFTQYFKVIALKIADANIKIRFNKVIIFPEIQGQQEQKKIFMQDFLITIERVAKLFPSLQAYFINSGESPIFQIYNKLKECNVRFPKWQGEQQYMMKASNNFRLNKQYNLCFLEELEKQKVDWLVMDPNHPTYNNLLFFLERNTENYKKICEQKQVKFSQNEWIELIDFKVHFEEMMERMIDDAASDDLDDLIWKGLNLKSNIQHAQQLIDKFQKGECGKQDLHKNLIFVDYDNQKIHNRMQQLSSYMKIREKQPIKVAINQRQAVVKSKVNLRIQQLASKKKDSCEIISQLQLYSRSFVANKLHSQQLMKQFLPIVFFHPMRKQRRMNNGIRLCSKEKISAKTQSPKKKGEETPKFRSMIQDPKKPKKGLKVLQKQHQKYQKYLQPLNQRQKIKYLSHQSMIIIDKENIKIQRSQIKSTNLLDRQILQVIFTCYYSDGSENIVFAIEQEPSIEIKYKKKIVSNKILEIQIKGLWIKFGFKIPQISFQLKNESFQIPLPFSFNNYLSIGSIRADQNKNSTKTQKYKLDKVLFPFPQSIKSYLKGIKSIDKEFNGCVKFFSWECNLRILFDQEQFQIQVDPTLQKQDDVLRNFLPIFLIRMLSQNQSQ